MTDQQSRLPSLPQTHGRCDVCKCMVEDHDGPQLTRCRNEATGQKDILDRTIPECPTCDGSGLMPPLRRRDPSVPEPCMCRKDDFQACGAIHTDTGIDCQHPSGHAGSHSGKVVGKGWASWMDVHRCPHSLVMMECRDCTREAERKLIATYLRALGWDDTGIPALLESGKYVEDMDRVIKRISE